MNPVSLIQYKDDEERIRAGAEREKCHSWVAEHLGGIVKLHQKLRNPTEKGVTLKERRLLAILVEMVVADAMHKDAEQRFLLGRGVYEKDA